VRTHSLIAIFRPGWPLSRVVWLGLTTVGAGALRRASLKTWLLRASRRQEILDIEIPLSDFANEKGALRGLNQAAGNPLLFCARFTAAVKYRHAALSQKSQTCARDVSRDPLTRPGVSKFLPFRPRREAPWYRL